MSNEAIRAELVKVLRQLASELSNDEVLELLLEALEPESPPTPPMTRQQKRDFIRQVARKYWRDLYTR